MDNHQVQGQKPKSSVFEEKIVGGKNISDGVYKKQNRTKSFEYYTFRRDKRVDNDGVKKYIPPNVKKVEKNQVDNGKNQSWTKHFMSQTFKRQNPRDIGDGENTKQKRTKNLEENTFSRDQSPDKDLAKKNIPANFKKAENNNRTNQSWIRHFISQTFKRQNRDNNVVSGNPRQDNAERNSVKTKNLEEKKKGRNKNSFH